MRTAATRATSQRDSPPSMFSMSVMTSGAVPFLTVTVVVPRTLRSLSSGARGGGRTRPGLGGGDRPGAHVEESA
jgi:hypothetical protein